jgi:hypothetical protein
MANIFDSVVNFLSQPPKAPKITSIPPGDLIYKALLCAIFAWLAQFVFEGIYNTFNSPLVPFPGPKLAAFTSWYKTYIEVFSGRSWIDVLEELHQKYGTCLWEASRT